MRECANPPKQTALTRGYTNGRARVYQISQNSFRNMTRSHWQYVIPGPVCTGHMIREPKINVVKRSSVSIGQLKRLLAVHRQPINLVVFQGTLGLASNETSSWDWLRAYMLSALIRTVRSYPAMPRARQQEHQRYVPPNP